MKVISTHLMGGNPRIIKVEAIQVKAVCLQNLYKLSRPV